MGEFRRKLFTFSFLVFLATKILRKPQKIFWTCYMKRKVQENQGSRPGRQGRGKLEGFPGWRWQTAAAGPLPLRRSGRVGAGSHWGGDRAPWSSGALLSGLHCLECPGLALWHPYSCCQVAEWQVGKTVTDAPCTPDSFLPVSLLCSYMVLLAWHVGLSVLVS